MDLEEMTVRDRFAMAAVNGLMGTVTIPVRLKETEIQILAARIPDPDGIAGGIDRLRAGRLSRPPSQGPRGVAASCLRVASTLLACTVGERSRRPRGQKWAAKL